MAFKYGCPHKNTLEIGNLKIFPNVFLSPMEGVTNNCFRRTVSNIAKGRHGLFISEFIAVEALVRKVPQAMRQMKFYPEERPFGIQIFGYDVEPMVEAAIRCEQAGVDLVEINAGCPAPKVVKRGGGSGLLKDLPQMARIISGIKEKISVPLTLKIRTGWDDGSINAVDTLRVAESEGIDAMVIHGRTRLQGYRGEADWEVIGNVKAKASIPIVGNGDLKTVEDCINRLNTYKVDGVSLGRGAMHNPYIFSQIADYYEGNDIEEPKVESLREIFQMYYKFQLDEELPEGAILGKMKQITSRFFKCIPHASNGRSYLLRSESIDEFFKNLDEFYIDYYKTSEFEFNPGAVQDLNGTKQEDIVFGNQFKK